MENIVLREVAEGDAEFLFRLMNDSAVRKALGEPPTLMSDWEQAIAAWEEDPDEEGYLVCLQGEPVGWFAVNGLLAEDGGVFLKMAALLPEYQNRGIGTAVLRELLGRLRGKGSAWFSSLPTGTINWPEDAMKNAGFGWRRQWCSGSRTAGKCPGCGWNVISRDDKNRSFAGKRRILQGSGRNNKKRGLCHE